MNIAVNTRLLLPGKLDGIGWFIYETLKRITTAHPEHTFIFIFDRKYKSEFVFNDNVIPVTVPPQARHPLLFYIWFEYSVPYILKKYKADLFLSPDGFLSLSSRVKSMNVIHDINFAHRKSDVPWLISRYYNYFFPKFAKKAARIITVSDYSKKDIVQQYHIPHSKIDVVYNGVNEIFKPLENSERVKIKEELTEGKSYFLYIGSIHPRKNISNLLLAYENFRKKVESDLKLVIAGAYMFKNGAMQKILSKMQYRHEVIFTGRLTTEKLSKITASALALTYVPFFEGFGIPLLEAMSSNVPVLTSNCTSMPEVCGDAACYADPYSIDSITDGMIEISGNKKLRNDLVLKGAEQIKKYSWDKTANKLWSAIEKSMH